MSEYNLTPQEAIVAIDNNYPPSNYTILREALEMAKEALKKQIPKRAELIDRTYDEVRNCPNCGNITSYLGKEFYCKKCGQKLEWSGLE
jgi:ribosomal protein S27AE